LNGGPEYHSIKVTVFSDDSKEPILIGDATIDLKPVFKEGEFDEWVELKYKNRYAGEVYLEMTYYSEAPPLVPPLPGDMQYRGMPSRGGSQSGSAPRVSRRPLPQQPNLGGVGPPPSRGVVRQPYDQLPPPTAHTTHASLDFNPHYQGLYDDLRQENDPRHPRNRSVDYAIPRHPAAYDRSYEYPHYDPPPSPTLGRHRSEASLRTQYYDIRPLQEVENMQHPAVNELREEVRRPRTSLPLPSEYENPYVDSVRDDRMRPRTSLPLPDPRMHPHPADILRDEARRPRTSLPLPTEAPPHRDDRPMTSNTRFRQAQRPESLDDYYHTPPPEEHPPIPVRRESITHLYEPSEEPLPVQPFRRETSLPPQTYSPKAISPGYSPHSTPQRAYSPQIVTPQTYSPTPPPHRTPPTRASASPRTPLNGPSPHPSPHVPLKKPSPVRAIDNLPPSSFAPEHTPPSQRRPLPTPPVVNSSPSEYSQASSPLAYRAPNIPAKIPLGLTEQEYRAMGEAEEAEIEATGGGEVRYRGLDGEWKEFRDHLPDVGYRR
jgi:neural Wiskott-Aldrich syndrome protein